MKIKDGFVVRNIGGRILAVATGDVSKEFHGMITLNKTGEFLWEQMQSECTERQLLEALMDKYEINEECAWTDLNLFVEKLKDAGILDER